MGTGAFLRVKREGKWVNLEVEQLTGKERTDNFINRSPEELIRWINLLCGEINKLTDERK